MIPCCGLGQVTSTEWSTGKKVAVWGGTAVAALVVVGLLWGAMDPCRGLLREYEREEESGTRESIRTALSKAKRAGCTWAIGV